MIDQVSVGFGVGTEVVAVDVGGVAPDEDGTSEAVLTEVVLGDVVGVPVGAVVAGRVVVCALGSGEGGVLVLSITGVVPGETVGGGAGRTQR